MRIWKECRDKVFLPLLNSLTDCSNQKELDVLAERIEKLEPDEILIDTETYRASRFSARSLRLEPNEQQMLSRDFAGYRSELLKLARMTSELFAAKDLIREIEMEINWSLLSKEINELSDQWPSLQSVFDGYLMPIIGVIESIHSDA